MPATQSKRPRPSRSTLPEATPTPWYKRVQNWIVFAAAVIAGAATVATNITTIKTSMSEFFGGQAGSSASSTPAPTPTPVQLRPDTPMNLPSKAAPERASNPANIAPPEPPSKLMK